MEERRLSDYVDKVYVINLLSRKDRREFIIRQLCELGVYYDLVANNKLEIVDAVIIPGINDNVISAINKENDCDIRTRGLFFCTNEHYRILKRAQCYNYDRILILEDDARFYHDKNKLFDAIETIPQDFDLAHFEGYYQPTEDYPTSEDWLSILADDIDSAKWEKIGSFRLWASAALMYSKKGINEIVCCLETWFKPIDVHTFLYSNNSYFYTYPLVIQENEGAMCGDIMEGSDKAGSTNIYCRKINKKLFLV